MVAISRYANDEPLLSLSPTYAQNTNVVNVYVDNSKHTITTSAATVGDVVRQFEVNLSEGDVVEPSLDSSVNQPVYNVNIYRSVPILIIDGDKQIHSQSGYRSPRQIVAAAGLQLYPEDTLTMSHVTEFVQDNTVGQKIIITRAKPIQIILSGKTYNIRTQAKFVKDLLAEHDISLNAEDLISVNPDDRVRESQRIVINRISQDVAVVNEAIAADTQVSYDDNLEVGNEKVTNPGSDGVRQLTYLVEYKDKKETKRSLLEQKIVKSASPRLVVRGRKQRDDVWFRLRVCESGNDYRKNTGNGFYGAYQFLGSTWNKYNTGYATANLAPSDVQDRIAKLNVALSAGGLWSQHPGCSRKLNLPQKP